MPCENFVSDILWVTLPINLLALEGGFKPLVAGTLSPSVVLILGCSVEPSIGILGD